MTSLEQLICDSGMNGRSSSSSQERRHLRVSLLRRDKQGAHTVLHLSVLVGPGLEQEPDHLEMPLLRSDKNRRGTASPLLVHIGSGIAQEAHDQLVPVV